MPQPDALLFTATGCPYCPGVKASLQKLQQEGILGTVEVHDISKEPELAAELGIRSVPWLKLGEFILTGAQSPQQLRQWAERASDAGGLSDYLAHLLEQGGMSEAESLLKSQPKHLPLLLSLLERTDDPIQVRLGISAILEGLEGSPELRGLLPQLIALSKHPDHRLRSDACHFLGLTHDERAREALEVCSMDNNDEVREIAAEALLTLGV